MSHPQPHPFSVPLAFYPITGPVGKSPIDWSFTNAHITIIRIWGDLNAAHDQSGSGSGPTDSGAVVGCDDGTLYVFHRSYPQHVAPESQVQTVDHPAPTVSGLAQSTHRSHSRTTSANSLAPFRVTPRPRVVSGVTAEKVEAPKNYVDFDDEPEKLKGMLKGRNPRESRSTDHSPKERSPGTSPTPSLIDAPLPKSTTKSTLSTNSASLLTTRPHSTPTSPRSRSSPQLDPPDEFNLWYHIIPPLSRSLSTYVADVQMLQSNELFAVLLSSGDIFIYRQEDGCCIAHTRPTTVPLQAGTEGNHQEFNNNVWQWSKFLLRNVEGMDIILAYAAVDGKSHGTFAPESDDTEFRDRTRISVFEVVHEPKTDYMDVKLVHLGQCEAKGLAEAMSVHKFSDGNMYLVKFTETNEPILQQLQISPALPLATPPLETHNSAFSSLSISIPFKSRSPDPDRDTLTPDVQNDSRIVIGSEINLGQIITDSPVLGAAYRAAASHMLVIAWTDSKILYLKLSPSSMRLLAERELKGVINVSWFSFDAFLVHTESLLYHFRICERISPGGAEPLHLVQAIGVDPSASFGFGTLNQVVAVQPIDGGQRLVSYTFGDNNVPVQTRDLWLAFAGDKSKPYLTTMLPLDLGLIFQGYADGTLRQYTLSQMAGRLPANPKSCETPLGGYLVALHTIQNPRTKEIHLVGGADDGSIAIWAIDTLKICARWTIFASPLNSVLQFHQDQAGPLRGCMMCIAQDGTNAVIAIDGFQLLYVVPAAATPLIRVCAGGENLLLEYADGRARLWDARTREFWRSMSIEKASELVGQGGWVELTIDKCALGPSTHWEVLSTRFLGPDAASTMLLNLERFLGDATELAKVIATTREQTRAIFLTIERLRWLLSVLITPGLNNAMEQLYHDKLGLQKTAVSVGLASEATTTLYQAQHPLSLWCISAEMSASLALAIVAVLRAISLFAGYADSAGQLTLFFSNPLTDVGPRYRPPSLVYLAQKCLYGSNEIKAAARAIFDISITHLTDEQANVIVEEWQHQMPSLQTLADAQAPSAALSLHLCGFVAAERYSLLSTSTITQISKSIVQYLHDDESVFRVLAVDLCSKGFHVWQHYIDAVEILRQLFTLATGTKKDSISVQNVATHARTAVLQIASSNTPLFMTTLGLDILSPMSVEHQKSVMQIVAYLIRKKPNVLQPNLPKFMEAVVKSLDPNSTNYRDAVLDTATDIISHVVKRYPSVDFHGSTQRLAVGTEEGAIIMYDLKTATRLYVLEGHKRKLTACSFSPDGRRLVTLSVKEGLVLIWKVGSTFASFFNPGAPPRQGHGGSEPFKSFRFNLGEAANMSDAVALEQVSFEWQDRNIRIKIQDGTLSFST